MNSIITIAECILRSTLSIRVQFILHLLSRLYARVRAWSMEKGLYPPTQNSTVHTGSHIQIGRKVGRGTGHL